MMKKTAKLMMVILAVGMTAGMVGCGENNSANTTTETAGEISSSENAGQNTNSVDQSEAAPETDTVDENEATVETADYDQALQAFQNLFEKSMAYVEKENMNGLKTLYRNADEETISAGYDALEDSLSDGYPDYQYYIIAGDGTYYFGEVLNSLTTESGSDTNFMCSNMNCCISYIEGEWKIDCSEEAWNAVNQELMNLYPEELLDASNAGRNAMVFQTDYSWTVSDITIPGTVDSRVYYAWQNEDGSVGVMVNIKNGTDVIQNISSTNVVLDDESLGEITNQSLAGDMLAPHTSKNYVYTFPTSEVETGTSQWTNVSCDCYSNY